MSLNSLESLPTHVHVALPPVKPSSRLQNLSRIASLDNKTYPYIQTKIQFIKDIALNAEGISKISRNPSLRKVLKHSRKVVFDKSCQRLPSQITNSIKNIKDYSLNPNWDLFSQSTTSLTTFFDRSCPKRLETLEINALYPSLINFTARRLLHLIKAQRFLKNLTLKIYLEFSLDTFKKLRTCLGHFGNLRTFSFMISKCTTTFEASNFKGYEYIGEVVSNMPNLQEFSFRCHITRTSYEEIGSILDSIVNLQKLKTLLFYFQITDQLPIYFYQNITSKTINLKSLKTFSVYLDTQTNQVIGTDFFSSFAKMSNLESLDITLTKAAINLQEIQVLLKSLLSLRNLKSFSFESNGRSQNFPVEYYENLYHVLSSLNNLKHFSLDVKNLNANYFFSLFNRLSGLPNMNSLKLNLSLTTDDVKSIEPMTSFLKKNTNLRSLALKINDDDSSYDTCSIPRDPFNALSDGLKELKFLKNLELTLGIIEDSIIEKILTIIQSLELESFLLTGLFQNISVHAFISLCECLLGQRGKIKFINVVPKCYPYELCELVREVASEVNSKRQFK